MALSPGPYKEYSDRTSQRDRSSYDSGSGNEGSDKALLEGEDDYGSGCPRHRQNDQRVFKVLVFNSVICGLALILLTWCTIKLYRKHECPALQPNEASKTETYRPAHVIPDITEPMEATPATHEAPNTPHSGTTADMFMFEDWKDCGKTADEARSKGCVFDLMLSSWVHKDCFDSKLMERYLFIGNYTWYRDYELLDPIPDEEIRRGDHHISYSTPQQHNAHCGYVWEVQMKAWMRGRPIPRALFSYPHTMHCAGWLVDHPPTNNTLLVTDFDRCGRPKRSL